MRKYFALLIMTVCIFVIFACGDSKDTSGSEDQGKETEQSNDEEAAGDSSDEIVELRIAWWGGQERHDLTLEIIDLYEARHPHVRITPEYSGFDGYFDKLSTQFAAGNAPDIIQYGGNLNDYVYRDVVLALDAYLGSELDISLHDETMIEAATFDGKFYGVTLGTNAWGVLLNKTLFAEAGVPLPDVDWTWDDFKDIAVELSESLDGVAGTEYFDHNGFGIYIDQKGKLLHEDGVLGIDQQDVEDWFALWQDLRDSGAVVIPEIQAASSTTPEQSMIVAREVAMQLIPSNQLGAYRNATQDELVFQLHPGMNGRSGVALRPSQFMAGYSETEHPEEVAKFLHFMVNDLEATAILGNDRGAPVNSEVRENLMAIADETDADIFAYIDLVSRTSDSPYVPNLPGYNETEALFKTTSEEIAFGKIDVQQGAEQYFTELTEVLEKNR
ncbi:multiple sugar transport system substrate-binding protein [Evansella caseinilytica]|uniref:Multiple sugar transport system substrate-binding protein n=1 Tax=Evansella caseinilytica TaxID=1503961 RepID=A0A1H3IHF0_9BACI|nr:extracellular solute-binding protein [Evansella caseinilytica]SDY26709.1 multiple sugar transport system substrate-binding protein [Evansella caseinilytica]